MRRPGVGRLGRLGPGARRPGEKIVAGAVPWWWRGGLRPVEAVSTTDVEKSALGVAWATTLVLAVHIAALLHDFWGLHDKLGVATRRENKA